MQHISEKTQFRVPDLQGSAEALVR